MIRYTSLASSSTYGNAYLIEGPAKTRLLVDCGPRQRRLESDLAALGVEPGSITAVLLTHEHGDHTYCLGLRRSFLARHQIAVYAHPAAWASCWALQNYLRCRGLERPPGELHLEPGQEMSLGELTVRAFATPHDSVSPLGFSFTDGASRLGLATDLGHVTAEVASNLAGSTHLVLESNHDRHLELTSGRPPHLIKRVLGDHGHLSNEQAARALAEVVGRDTRTILLAHLSLDCNHPELAVETVMARLGVAGWRGLVAAAPAAGPSGWIG